MKYVLDLYVVAYMAINVKHFFQKMWKICKQQKCGSRKFCFKFHVRNKKISTERTLILKMCKRLVEFMEKVRQENITLTEHNEVKIEW